MKQVFFNLLKSGISDNKSDFSAGEISAENISTLVRVAKKHDLSGVLAYSLLNGNLVADDSIIESLKKEEYLSIMRYERLRYTLEQVTQTFENNQIDFIVLKGTVLREFYPKPYLRTSCDIDLFIKEKSLKKALKVLKESGFIVVAKNPHDISLSSPEKVIIELHFSFFNDKNLAKQMQNVWQESSLVGGKKHYYQMNNELFVFYHIAHMFKHFVNGGCGIRPFADLWIIKNKIVYNREKLEEKLNAVGLKTFTDRCFELAEIWFGEGAHNQTTLNMENYLVRGGAYGHLEQRVAVGKVKKGSGFKYFLSRIFTPFSQLKLYYPILKKVPVLYPFCLIIRGFKGIFSGGKKTAKEIKISKNSSTNNAVDVEKLIKDLEI